MNDSFVIRRATPGDIPALCALEIECFSLPWSEKSFCEFFGSADTAAYVAEADGVIIGYAGMYISFGDGEITDIAVTPKHRRCGAASALINALGSTDGINRLLLEVRESNTPARSMYEKLSFKTDCIRRSFYSNPKENAVLMSLETNGLTP